MKNNIVLMFLLILFVITNCTLFTDGNKIVYITLLDLKHYHNYDCRTLDDIRNYNRDKIISINKKEAEGRNLEPCIICKP